MGKWLERYVWFKNIWGIGEQQIGFIKNLSNVGAVLAVLTFVGIYYPELKALFLFLAPIAVGFYIVAIVGFGFFLDKRFKIVHSETRWHNSRNPEIVEILAKLRRLEHKP